MRTCRAPHRSFSQFSAFDTAWAERAQCVFLNDHGTTTVVGKSDIEPSNSVLNPEIVAYIPPKRYKAQRSEAWAGKLIFPPCPPLFDDPQLRSHSSPMPKATKALTSAEQQVQDAAKAQKKLALAEFQFSKEHEAWLHEGQEGYVNARLGARQGTGKRGDALKYSKKQAERFLKHFSSYACPAERLSVFEEVSDVTAA